MDPFTIALMQDGLDGLLAEIPDWTENDGNELMDSDEEEDLLIASRRSDQQGGNPLFSVNMERIQPPRSFHNGTAIQTRARFTLQQLRPSNGEFQGEAVAEAFYQGLVEFVNNPANGLANPEDYSMSMAIHHNTGTHTWVQCHRFPVTEWLQGSEQTRQWLEKLAKQLNSAENFDAANREFYAELSFFKTQQRGGGYRKNNTGVKSFAQLLKKTSIITVKNTDNLCLARALVTMKEWVDQDPDKHYENLRKGFPIQERLAKLLHRDAGIPEGTCGFAEVEQMQNYLGPLGYQIKIFHGQNGALWFHKEEFNEAPKKLCLLKMEDHFHGIKSVPGFLNRSYFCHNCNRGFNTQNAENHNCERQNCDKCRRTQGKCKSFKDRQPASMFCPDCGQSFRGQDCFNAHKRSRCEKIKKCPLCCKVYKLNKKKKHVCGVYKCRNCKTNVLPNHQCYIQPLKDDFSGLDDPNMSPEDRAILEAVREEQEGQDKDEPPPPLVCCIDFECAVDENKEFEDVRVGWQYVNVKNSYREAGKASDMLEDVMSKTITSQQEERQVFVFAHNMRCFDSSFILQLLYDKGYQVEKILSMGAKFLSFQCGNVIFPDSLNFFSMPLERLPATFNLHEAHKGFFPYSYISESKLSYVGPYPPAEEYHPERMNEKRRKQFLTWHKQKVDSGEIFDCEKELSLYLKSDVQVLTEAMETFAKEMMELTGVDPTMECVTIASTAFKVFQKNFLEPYLIALEPVGGWRHNQQNQSVEAPQWLEFENRKIGGGIEVSCSVFRQIKIVSCSVFRQIRNNVSVFYGK